MNRNLLVFFSLTAICLGFFLGKAGPDLYPLFQDVGNQLRLAGAAPAEGELFLFKTERAAYFQTRTHLDLIPVNTATPATGSWEFECADIFPSPGGIDLFPKCRSFSLSEVRLEDGSKATLPALEFSVFKPSPPKLELVLENGRRPGKKYRGKSPVFIQFLIDPDLEGSLEEDAIYTFQSISIIDDTGRPVVMDQISVDYRDDQFTSRGYKIPNLDYWKNIRGYRKVYIRVEGLSRKTSSGKIVPVDIPVRNTILPIMIYGR